MEGYRVWVQKLKDVTRAVVEGAHSLLQKERQQWGSRMRGEVLAATIEETERARDDLWDWTREVLGEGGIWDRRPPELEGDPEDIRWIRRQLEDALSKERWRLHDRLFSYLQDTGRIDTRADRRPDRLEEVPTSTGFSLFFAQGTTGDEEWVEWPE